MSIATEVLPSNQAPPAPRRVFRTVANVTSTVLTVLVVMVAAFAIVIAVATHLSPKGDYTVFGHPVLTVLSGSMTPTIRTGDLIVDDRVSTTEATQLHVGQIITFREAPGSTTTLTHRIVKVVHRGGSVFYETKGDANNAPDATLRPASDVIALFSYAIPRGGYILNALHRPLVLALLLASPVLWFLAGPLFELARNLDGEAGEEPAVSAGEAEGEMR